MPEAQSLRIVLAITQSVEQALRGFELFEARSRMGHVCVCAIPPSAPLTQSRIPAGTAIVFLPSEKEKEERSYVQGSISIKKRALVRSFPLGQEQKQWSQWGLNPRPMAY